MQQNKKELAEGIIGDVSGNISTLSKNELLELFD